MDIPNYGVVRILPSFEYLEREQIVVYLLKKESFIVPQIDFGLQLPALFKKKYFETLICEPCPYVVNKKYKSLSQYLNVDDEFIIHIMFQLIFIMTKIQVDYGIMHNNINLNNIMIEELDDTETFQFIVDGKDYFQFESKYRIMLSNWINDFSNEFSPPENVIGPENDMFRVGYVYLALLNGKEYMTSNVPNDIEESTDDVENFYVTENLETILKQKKWTKKKAKAYVNQRLSTLKNFLTTNTNVDDILKKIENPQAFQLLRKLMNFDHTKRATLGLDKKFCFAGLIYNRYFSKLRIESKKADETPKYQFKTKFDVLGKINVEKFYKKSPINYDKLKAIGEELDPSTLEISYLILGLNYNVLTNLQPKIVDDIYKRVVLIPTVIVSTKKDKINEILEHVKKLKEIYYWGYPKGYPIELPTGSQTKFQGIPRKSFDITKLIGKSNNTLAVNFYSTMEIDNTNDPNSFLKYFPLELGYVPLLYQVFEFKHYQKHKDTIFNKFKHLKIGNNFDSLLENIGFNTKTFKLTNYSKFNINLLFPIKKIIESYKIDDTQISQTTWNDFKTSALPIGLLHENEIPYWASLKELENNFFLPPLTIRNKQFSPDDFELNQKKMAQVWAIEIMLLILKLTSTSYNLYVQKILPIHNGKKNEVLKLLENEAKLTKRTSFILDTKTIKQIKEFKISPIEFAIPVLIRAQKLRETIPFVEDALQNIEYDQRDIEETYDKASVMEKMEYLNRLQLFVNMIENIEKNNGTFSNNVEAKMDYITPFQTSWRYKPGQTLNI